MIVENESNDYNDKKKQKHLGCSSVAYWFVEINISLRPGDAYTRQCTLAYWVNGLLTEVWNYCLNQCWLIVDQVPYN